jgi:hypothetical protein
VHGGVEQARLPYLKKRNKIRWDGNGGDVKVIL